MATQQIGTIITNSKGKKAYANVHYTLSEGKITVYGVTGWSTDWRSWHSTSGGYPVLNMNVGIMSSATSTTPLKSTVFQAPANAIDFPLNSQYYHNISDITYEVKSGQSVYFRIWFTGGSSSTINGVTLGSTSSTSAITVPPTTYTVSYSANGGSGAPSSQTKTYGTTLTLSSTKPTRTGYTFNGWNTNSSGTGTNYSSGGSYTSNSAVTLYAKWTKLTYTVAYNANGGSGAPSSQTKSYGTTLTLSSTKPTRTGYTFRGWGTSSSTSTVSYYAGGSYTSNSAVTLYALWSLNTYWISFNANGGSGAPVSQLKYYGVTLYLSSTKPTRTGYTFSCWNSNSSGTGSNYYSGGSYTGNAVATLYAKWTLNSYTVTYNANSGSGAPSSQTKYYGTTLTLSSTKPTRTGYTFLGWSTSSSATSATYASSGSYTSNSAVTLYAVWSLITYAIAYSANGGSGAPSSQTKTYGTTLYLSTTKPTRTGYNFLGWSTSSSATSATYSSGSSYTTNSAATLYAVWSLITYDVNYNVNEGSGTVTSQTKSYGINLTLSSTIPTRTGYDFVSWNTNASGYGTNYNSGDTYSTNSAVTLYAQWKLQTYTIIFDATEGTNPPAAITKTYGTHVFIPGETPTRADYTFLGWNTLTDGAGATYNSGDIYATEGDATLYAIWGAKTYLVKYDGNGGENPPASQIKITDIDLLLSVTKPYLEGKQLLGWSESATATTPSYYGASVYSENRDILLYAVWTDRDEVSFVSYSNDDTYRIYCTENESKYAKPRMAIKRGDNIYYTPLVNYLAPGTAMAVAADSPYKIALDEIIYNNKIYVDYTTIYSDTSARLAFDSYNDMKTFLNGNINIRTAKIIYNVVDEIPMSFSKLFQNCVNLESVDLTLCEIKNLYSTSYMFENCSSLTNVSFANVDMSGIQYMHYMFSGCSGLVVLDLADFDTSNVEYAHYMFYNCLNLTDLYITSFDTNKMVNMTGMFENCKELLKLDLTSFDMVNVEYIDSMFVGCESVAASYGKTQEDCDVLNSSYERPDNVWFGLKSISNMVSIGDYVNYDAGEWTSKDLSSITLGSSSNPTLDLPTEQGKFGGFTVNSSRNSNSTSLEGLSPALSGWRVWSIEGDIVTLVHAGHSETYYHGYTASGSSSASLSILRNRDMSMYLNSYASSAKFMTGEDYATWYNKNIENTGLTLSDNGNSTGLYGGSYSTTDTMLTTNNSSIGAYYWLATSADSDSLYYFGADADSRCIYSWHSFAGGVRVLITLKNTVSVSDGDGSVESPWQLN